MSLSFVIPTVNDAPALARTLRCLHWKDVVEELLVVDGDSSDGTAAVARRFGAQVVNTSPVRGRQLDFGWREARTDLVCFLYPGFCLTERAVRGLVSVFEDPRTAVAAFRVGFRSRDPGLARLSFWYMVRTVLFGMPSGLQALTVRRRDLERLGGIPHWRDDNDLYLVRTLRRRGALRLLDEFVYLPPEPFLERGVGNAFRDDLREALAWRRYRVPGYLHES